MVVFEELRITNDGETLVIKVKVRDESYYENVYLQDIIIDTEATYVEGGPSENPVYQYGVDPDTKSITLTINKAQIVPDFKEHLFFVYVVTYGAPSSDVPCGMDNETTLGVTMYMGNVYNNFMDYIREMNSGNCQVPNGFIDQLLRYKAMSLAMDSGHYTQGIEYYNQWFSGRKQRASVTTNCGCNG